MKPHVRREGEDPTDASGPVERDSESCSEYPTDLSDRTLLNHETGLLLRGTKSHSSVLEIPKS